MRRIRCIVRLVLGVFLLVGAPASMMLAYGQSGPVGVLISPQNSFVSIGSPLQFTATREVQHWLTSDPTIATISSAGMATGVQPGAATISAVSGIFRTSTTLTVVALPGAISLFSSPAAPIAAGQSVTLFGTFSGGAGVITNDKDSSKLLVTSGIGVSVTPASTTTYTLTVTNLAGSTRNGTIQIGVLPAPSIGSFNAANTFITTGNSVTLIAAFSGGSGTINPGNISVPVSPAAVIVFPSASTAYTLTINGVNGSTAMANTTVQVVPPPIFTGGSFIGTPAIVTAGTNPSVILNIPTFSAGATGVVTNNVNAAMLVAASGGTLSISGVNTTTTFILTETNQAGTSISAPFTVTAVPAPVATSLTASVPAVTSGSSVLLFPNFSNGTGVINNGVGNVGSGSAVSTGLLSSNTAFLLMVTNAAGATAAISSPTINVVPAPSISSFTATPNTIISGQSLQLTGNFVNGTGVVTNSVNGLAIPVPTAPFSITVSPTANVIYTLTVTNAAGTSTTANTYVDVD